MHRFWDTIIGPAFEIIRPRSIVEIGVCSGLHTKRVLEYCTKTGAVLHAIDPTDCIDAHAWMRTYEPSFVFHRDLSLNVLGKIERMDVVLIDGDHNWYTVYHELILLEKYAQKSGKFPIVFLHDTGWPYARRDLYYAPERIPDAHKKAYAKEGMLPGVGMLSKTEGLNPMLCNAVEENDLRNGVLTAVEDFLRDSPMKLRLINIPGINGLGMIVSEQELENNPALASFTEGLRMHPVLQSHMENIERERIKEQLRAKGLETHGARLEAEKTAYEMRIAAFERERDMYRETTERRMNELQSDLAHLRHSRSWRWTLPMRLAERTVRSSGKRCYVLLKKMHRHIRVWVLRFFPEASGLVRRTLRQMMRPVRMLLRAPSNNAIKEEQRDNIVIVEPDWAAMRGITIVIPVYNAFDATVRCIESVLRHSPASHKIVVVDDASTDGRVREYLSSVASKNPQRVTVLRNDQNRGFVQSANAGMRHATHDDVILLNNDTVVPPTWAERLQEAAYSLPHAASITPLSNEASIYSVLHDSIESLLQRFEVADIDRHIERYSQVRFPEIPTAVGFCMFIKREALNGVGLFDERFGIGYGEENDWCMRAKNMHFRHYLHDGCFVYHAGHVSMKEAGHTQGEGSVPAHEELLRSLHPRYQKNIEDFSATGTMLAIRLHVEGNIDRCVKKQKRIAYVLHNPIRGNTIGGVEYHVADLQDALQTGYEFFTISPVGNSLVVQSESGDGITERLYRYYKKGSSEQDVLDAMDAILRRFEFDLVHVHHTMHMTFAILPLIREHAIPVVYSVHDWLFVNEKTHPISVKNVDVISFPAVRNRTPHLQAANVIVVSTNTVMDVARSVYDTLPTEKRLIPFGRDMERLSVPPRTDGPTVCFLSYAHADHKGKALVKELVPRLLKKGCRVVFLGSQPHYWPEFNREPMVEFAGLYDRSTVEHELKKIAPHLICIVSTTPETHCYAIDEAWHAGIPVYVTPIGAPAERVNRDGGGRVAPSFDPDAMTDDMISFIQSDACEKARQDIRNMRFVSSADMAESHRTLYEELTSEPSSVKAP